MFTIGRRRRQPSRRRKHRPVAQAAIDSFINTRGAPEGEALPRSTWVYQQVLQGIHSGELAAGARLPSARRLALAWAVSRGAIDEALARLQAEGLVERRVGNGSYVAARRPAATPAGPPPTADPLTQQVVQRLTAWSAQARVFRRFSEGPPMLRPGMPDTGSFPLAAWRRCLAQVLADPNRAALSYGIPAGVTALREATARHLSLTRAIHCRPEQVLIVGSPRQGIELMARVLLAPGEQVCVEDPGPVSVTRRFSLGHVQVVSVPPDEQGFDVALARRHAPAAAAMVVQPLHQWPTGVRTSTARRQALLDDAADHGSWLVEMDSLGEIVHDGAAPAPMQSADRAGRLIFLGSFAALTFPGLRLAYMVLPEVLVNVFAAVRGLMGEHSSVVMQRALAAFIDEGHLAAHVRTVRQLYRERRDAVVQGVRCHVGPGAVLGPVDGGIHACLHLGPAWHDAALCERLNRQGVAVQPLSAHTWEPRGLNGLLLGYGADEPDTINRAVASIAAAMEVTVA